MANSKAERAIKTGMKAYLRVTGWVAGPDRSVGGMWNRLLEETRQEMAESKAGRGDPIALPAASSGSMGSMDRAVERAATPRAVSEREGGKFEEVDRAPLHVSSLQADHATEGAPKPATTGSTPTRSGVATGAPTAEADSNTARRASSSPPSTPKKPEATKPLSGPSAATSKSEATTSDSETTSRPSEASTTSTPKGS